MDNIDIIDADSTFRLKVWDVQYSDEGAINILIHSQKVQYHGVEYHTEPLWINLYKYEPAAWPVELIGRDEKDRPVFRSKYGAVYCAKEPFTPNVGGFMELFYRFNCGHLQLYKKINDDLYGEPSAQPLSPGVLKLHGCMDNLTVQLRRPQ